MLPLNVVLWKSYFITQNIFHFDYSFLFVASSQSLQIENNDNNDDFMVRNRDFIDKFVNNTKASEIVWMGQKDLFHSLSECSWETDNRI